MDVRIRKLKAEEMKDSLKLSQFAFQYELSPEEEKDRLNRLRPEDSWGAFLGEGSLAAKLTVLPLAAYIGGREVPMGGIAGVATWPEYRREGLVKRLLQHVLAAMKEQGQTISFLHPFQFEFYRRFGWETYTEYKTYELETVQLPKFPETGGRMERLPGTELLNGIYASYARRFNGTLVRTPEWWEWNIRSLKNKSGHSAAYYGPDGTPKGYLLYKVRDQVLTVNEMVALDGEARRALWNYIGNHDSMVKKVVLQAEAGDRLTSLLKNPRIKQETVPYFMARLVDVKAFLAEYRFQAGSGGSFRLALTDPYAPWNEGLYEVEVGRDGSAQVHYTPGPEPEVPPEGLGCGVGILTAVLLGYESPRFWQEAGRLNGAAECVDQLEALLPPRKTHLFDFF
ncbi:GNAT family N-acetyltransferase [Gorillibacterium sp. sgz5001074]|uniref:GNAT family N-acetyltransferase n=1 Tax=Gorillibacterium sp. sgz5001074 TaxID=3446695 RepID=UPI003F67F386